MNLRTLDDITAIPDMAGICQSELVLFSESDHFIRIVPEDIFRVFHIGMRM